MTETLPVPVLDDLSDREKELVTAARRGEVPLSPTGVRARCDLNTGTTRGQVLTVCSWLVQAAVRGLATLALAGYTSLIRKTA